MSNWQPIETAPKDGETVLVWGKLDWNEVPAAYSAWWEFGDDCWMATAIDQPHIVPGAFYCVYVNEVTHWMPLPEAPDNLPGDGEKTMGDA